MSVASKIRRILYERFDYNSREKRTLVFIYKFPKRHWYTIARYAKYYYTQIAGKYELRMKKDGKYILGDFKADHRHFVNQGLIEWDKNYFVYPAKVPSNSGLWLVNPNTGELLRPLTKLEEVIGRFYRKGSEFYIALPKSAYRMGKSSSRGGGTYEVVDGAEYGSHIYTRDSEVRRRGYDRTKNQKPNPRKIRFSR